MKTCLSCHQAKAEADFYRQGNSLRLQNRCKSCHNAACQERRRTNPEYRARQYAAKKHWEVHNRQRVRLHQRRCHGRLIWDPYRADVPSLCREVEAAMWLLFESISAR